MKSIVLKFLPAIFLLSIVFACGNSSDHKVVFIDTIKVFEGFEMKKDYDDKMEKDLHAESTLLDSVSILLEKTSKSVDTMSLMKLRKDYYIADKIFNEKFQALSQQYTTEVNTRLNEYLKEYGKEKNFDFILGSGGQGNVMYVNESNDITKDIITYINSKYSK